MEGKEQKREEKEKREEQKREEQKREEKERKDEHVVKDNNNFCLIFYMKQKKVTFNNEIKVKEFRKNEPICENKILEYKKKAREWVVNKHDLTYTAEKLYEYYHEKGWL